jgi:hypothetical protein
LSAWTWSFFAVILEKGHPSTRTFLLVGRDFTTNVPRIRSSLQSKKITEAERTLHTGSRGGRSGRRPPALIPCLPRLPRLISARAEAAQLTGSLQPGWSLLTCSSRQPRRNPPTHISRSTCLARRGWGGTRPCAFRNGQDGTRPLWQNYPR